ncbi:MAG: uroporphyrinogen-III C-methyltransferase [Cytophagaceae bacterium]
MRRVKLTLVGAGPGDPDLITVKGLKAIADADVILYDALAHPDLLKFAPARAIKLFVGKKRGVCQFAQEDINRLIVENALKYGHVVRLKGGDPFIFGRGHEEIVHAQAFNIETEVIPGISSSISVPELQQIPLTRRGVNDSFWVLTGTTRHHELSADIENAARSNATVVILMGMTKLQEITEIFKKEGKGKTAVAIIQNGTLPEEKYALGTIDTIFEIAAAEELSSPAIIVIGDVVTLHPEWITEKVREMHLPIEEKGKTFSQSRVKNFYNIFLRRK